MLFCVHGANARAIALEVHVFVTHINNLRFAFAYDVDAMLADEVMVIFKTAMKRVEGPELNQGSVVDPALGFDVTVVDHGGTRPVTFHVGTVNRFNAGQRDFYRLPTTISAIAESDAVLVGSEQFFMPMIFFTDFAMHFIVKEIDRLLRCLVVFIQFTALVVVGDVVTKKFEHGCWARSRQPLDVSEAVFAISFAGRLISDRIAITKFSVFTDGLGGGYVPGAEADFAAMTHTNDGWRKGEAIDMECVECEFISEIAVAGYVGSTLLSIGVQCFIVSACNPNARWLFETIT